MAHVEVAESVNSAIGCQESVEMLLCDPTIAHAAVIERVNSTMGCQEWMEMRKPTIAHVEVAERVNSTMCHEESVEIRDPTITHIEIAETRNSRISPVEVESTAMACLRCGDRMAPLFVNETWAGTFHAACNHATCEDCLRDWIRSELPRCRAENQLRVFCCAPGCKKFIPQTLVFHVSSAAGGLALEIDRNNNDVHARYERLPVKWKQETCRICNDYVGPTLECEECKHSACEFCTGRWVDMQLPRCKAERCLNLRCFRPDCNKPMLEKVALLTSNAACDVKRALKKRERLQANVLFPPEMQLNCPQPGCVGLGYTGFDTIMCFLCEHQWSLMDGVAPEDGLPGSVKNCPKCGVQIEKNGGCDHMTCRCGHEFYWTTMMPYRS
jgi:hypothetical protein